MAETDNGAAAEANPAQQAQPKLQILGQFIRDLSFENILSQKPITGEVNPEIQVQVGVDLRKRGETGQFEVVIKFNISSKNKNSDDTLFVLELDYGAIVSVENVPDEQLHPYLMIEAPRMVFPFARRVISDVTRDGGFPPLNLENMDFVALYRQQMIQQAAQKAQQTS